MEGDGDNEAGLYSNVPKTVLRPRRPGESIKVAQVVLKRRDRNLKAAAERAAKLAQTRKNQMRSLQDGRLVRLETLVRQSLGRKWDRNRVAQITKRGGLTQKQRPANPSEVIMVFRNAKLTGSKASYRALEQLRLYERMTGAFMVSNLRTYTLLRIAEPFVFWGRPSFKTVFNLVHKKALFRPPDAPKEKVLLSDNNIIEKHLGDLGVVCTEDLVDVIYNNGPSFGRVTDRLWPFALGDDRAAKSMIRERHHKSGLMPPEKINEIVTSMLGE